MKSLWIWIVLGLILRLAVIPFTLHPDIRGHNYAAFLISQQGKLLTFYDHVRQLPREDQIASLYGDGIFIYPPLAYYAHALFMLVLGPIYPWGTFHSLISDMGQTLHDPQLTQLLYLLKAPYLVVDGIGLFLIWKLVASDRRKLAALLWIFNPITFYSAYMLGQFDIYIAVFVLLALHISTSKRPWLAGVALGIAAAFKPFPLILLPFLPNRKIQSIIAGLATYLVIISPYLTSIGFRQYALLASQSDKLLYAKVMISGSQYLPLYVVGLGVLLWLAWLTPKKYPAWVWLSTPLLLFYSVTHFHPQWFTWISPMLILYLVNKKENWILLLVLLLSYLMIIVSFEPSLNTGLFYNLRLPTIHFSDQLVSIVRGIFAATSLVLVLGQLSHKEISK